MEPERAGLSLQTMSRSGKHELSVVDHDRNSVELTYVYPVVSRRAGGVSIGVNLNPNNACNWRCVYCQVPGLVFGKAPPADLKLLETELRQMFDAVLHGDFMAERVPEGARNLRDVAFSGNGEPTSCLELDAALETVAAVLGDFGLLGKLPVVLITNGSLLHLPRVRTALERLSGMGGEVWFKLDSATEQGARRINSCQASPQEHLNKLRAAASLCPTWVQTCLFQWHGAEPTKDEQDAYLDALRGLVQDAVPLRGVLLYTTARPSHQPEAPALQPLPLQFLEAFASRIRELGLDVRVSG